MNINETMGQFFVNRLKRSAVAAIGLLMYAVGVYFQLQADLGMQPWQAMRLGLANQLSVSFGTVSIAMSLILIVIDVFLKQRIGLGTFLDAFLVGVGMDICIALDFLPVQNNMVFQLFWIFAGMVVCSIGQWLYMATDLSCGPVDSFLLGVGALFPKISIGKVNLGILAVVLAICMVLKSPVGIGTVITVFGTGFVMDAVFKIVKFKPRKVVHEGLIDTATIFMQALRQK